MYIFNHIVAGNFEKTMKVNTALIKTSLSLNDSYL